MLSDHQLGQNQSLQQELLSHFFQEDTALESIVAKNDCGAFSWHLRLNNPSRDTYIEELHLGHFSPNDLQSFGLAGLLAIFRCTSLICNFQQVLTVGATDVCAWSRFLQVHLRRICGERARFCLSWRLPITSLDLAGVEPDGLACDSSLEPQLVGAVVTIHGAVGALPVTSCVRCHGHHRVVLKENGLETGLRSFLWSTVPEQVTGICGVWVKIVLTRQRFLAHASRRQRQRQLCYLQIQLITRVSQAWLLRGSRQFCQVYVDTWRTCLGLETTGLSMGAACGTLENLKLDVLVQANYDALRVGRLRLRRLRWLLVILLILHLLKLQVLLDEILAMMRLVKGRRVLSFILWIIKGELYDWLSLVQTIFHDASTYLGSSLKGSATEAVFGSGM